ncbi:hypothetical protein AURDEDRAFT_124370 [Auricularia subglabra TFB-10046 SS5]|nr:hypothetical protein AURDEDRAFT_124370 [Auricularia subglabra TFB-10046 SS5]
MLSDVHASVVQSCVEAVVDDTLNSNVPTTPAEAAQVFRALHASVLAATRFTLAQRARSLNAYAAVNRLPPELLCRVAAHLPYSARCSALLVCGQWHAVLLSDSSLWNNITLSLRHAPWRWPAAVSALLARTRGRATTLSLQCEAPAYANAAAADVARIVQAHMTHLVELALSLSSTCAAAWIGVLTSPAPLLHTFRLQIHPAASPASHCSFEMTKQLPGTLFRCSAPHLHHLALTGVLLPEDPCPAVCALTSLAYDRIPHLKPAHLTRVFELCPQLKCLTLTSRPHPTDVFAVLPEAARLDELRVADVPRVEALLGALCGAQRVCRSFLFNPAPLPALRAMVLFPPPCADPGALESLELGMRGAAAAHTGVHAHAFASVALGDAAGRCARAALTIVTDWTPRSQSSATILQPGTCLPAWPGESTRNLRALTVTFARIAPGDVLPATLLLRLIRSTLNAPPLERLVLARRGTLADGAMVDQRLSQCAKRVVLESGPGAAPGGCRCQGHWVWGFPMTEAAVM